jgi:hypothetical protein
MTLPGGGAASGGAAAVVVCGAASAVVVVGDGLAVVVCVPSAAVGLSLSPSVRLPMSASSRKTATTLPTMIQSRRLLLVGGLGGGALPHSCPFQYACPPVPAGSGYQPGGGVGGVVTGEL